MNKKPKYDYLGERIEENNYYSRKKQKEFDFYNFFKILGTAAGIGIAVSYIIQIFQK